MNIEELIEFQAKTKAVATEVNQNFETLRVSNNEHYAKLQEIDSKYSIDGGKLSGAIVLNDSQELLVESDTLELNSQTNYFKLSGNTTIENLSGLENGFVILEFLDARVLCHNDYFILQNNVNRICSSGDYGIYYIENGVAKEINYFCAKEDQTNSYMPQTILHAPKDELGKADFLECIELGDSYIPVKSDYEDEDTIVSASSYFDAYYLPWKAFRGHTSDIYGWLTVASATTGWLKIEFLKESPEFKVFAITARNVSTANTNAPCDFCIEGSNDDVNWSLLGDYSGNLNWLQNEKRYFALSYSEPFKYYRLTISTNSGGATSSGFGAIDFYESVNDLMPMSARLNFSMDSQMLLNNGVGTSSIGNINKLSTICTSSNLDSLYNNAYMYVAYQKDSDSNELVPKITTAAPVYSNCLQKHSSINAVPTMISATTSSNFKYGYTVTSSGYSTVSTVVMYPYLAFNNSLSTRWRASVAGGNQWLSIAFPNYRTAARFSITPSSVEPLSCVKNGYIKGFNGEEWVVLKEITDVSDWVANEVKHFDADLLTPCNEFKLEITDIVTSTLFAQVAQFQIYELANCFVIPENQFYTYNIETESYETTEINYVGRIKTEQGFVSEVQSYAINQRYVSEEIPLAINTTYAFYHNTGLDYKNLKVKGWIRDRVNGFIMPWHVNSALATASYNNNGFYIDDCLFYVRTGAGLMQYIDSSGTTRTLTANCSLILEIERSF